MLNLYNDGRKKFLYDPQSESLDRTKCITRLAKDLDIPPALKQLLYRPWIVSIDVVS